MDLRGVTINRKGRKGFAKGAKVSYSLPTGKGMTAQNDPPGKCCLSFG